MQTSIDDGTISGAEINSALSYMEAFHDGTLTFSTDENFDRVIVGKRAIKDDNGNFNRL